MKKLIVLAIVFNFFVQNLFAQTNENKGFIGIALGPSIPLGDFAKTGYSDHLINFGYRFGQNFGICASVFYDQYNDISASFRYNFSKRWCILTDAGFLSSNQNFLDERKEKKQTIRLGLGIAYNFKFAD